MSSRGLSASRARSIAAQQALRGAAVAARHSWDRPGNANAYVILYAKGGMITHYHARSLYFVRCIYVLTSDVSVNISRVRSREKSGGHGVPEEKIRSRYKKALDLVPELVKLCDVMHIYDNTLEPFRIFKKRKDEYFFWENDEWNEERISELTIIKR